MNMCEWVNGGKVRGDRSWMDGMRDDWMVDRRMDMWVNGRWMDGWMDV